MKFIETKREELRRENIVLIEHELDELCELLLRAGEKTEKIKNIKRLLNPRITAISWTPESGWVPGEHLWAIPLSELKAKYFEPEQREPKPGDWGYFWDHDDKEYATFGKLLKIDGSAFHTSLPYKHFSHTIPPHIQELMKAPEYEVVYSFGESSGEIKEIAPGLYAGTRGGVPVILKRK